MSEERWEMVAGYGGRYAISDEGRVKSYPTKTRKSEKIMSPTEDGQGYKSVWLCLETGGKRHKIHLLVAEAFLGPRPKGCVCRHLDGNNQHNAVRNLKWGTGDENREDMIAHGTRLVGERNPASKLTEESVSNIRVRLGRGETGMALAREFGVSATAITNIRKGRVWVKKTAQVADVLS